MSRAARKNIPPYPKGKPLPPGMKRGRKGRLKRRSLVWRVRRVLLMLVLMSVIAVSGGAYLVWNNTELPQKEPPLLQTSFICAAEVTNDCNQDNSIAQLSGGVDRVTVGYDKIPALFVQALISAEDKDFFRHQGVDPAGVGRALYRNIKNEKIQQGGSTITQQYVKNVYLSNEQTISRKVNEAVLAIKLDRELPKQEILERYLNTIYFGRGAYGIEAAARAYFGKHVEELGLPESSYLAGIIREPEGVDANRQPTDPLRERQQRAATDRRKQVLDAMLSEGYITAPDRDGVAKMGWDYVLPRSSAKNFGNVKHPELGTEYFVDYVRHWLTSTGRFTDSQLYGGGLRIYTTLDYGAQANAYAAIANVLDRPDDPAASIVALDDRGRVRAMVGGFDYEKSQVNLAVGQEGGGSGRQPGSAFKPVVLAQYIAAGKNLGQTYNAPGKLNIKLPGEPWTVANYGDAEQGQLNVVDATRKSSNTAYAQIMLDTGPQSVVDLAKKMGITSNLNAYPSLVLGTSEVSVLDMASAYSTFAASGEHIDPVVVTKVTNAQGQVLFDATFEKQRAMPKDTADAVNWVLNQVVETGTGTGARVPGQTVAGKTGTTENYRDAWFAGYTCKMTAAVWVGYPLPLPNGQPHYMQGVHGINVAGGTLPATIFNRFMSKATQGLQSCAFPKPANVNDVPTGTLPVVGTTPPTTPGTAPPSTEAPGTTAAPASSTTTAAPSTTTPEPSSTTTPASSTTVPETTTTVVVAAKGPP